LADERQMSPQALAFSGDISTPEHIQVGGWCNLKMRKQPQPAAPRLRLHLPLTAAKWRVALSNERLQGLVQKYLLGKIHPVSNLV
jgi:hypothetical protein